MKIIISSPLWTKVCYAIGIALMAIGIFCHFSDFKIVPSQYMAFFLIGGVIFIIPYQFFYLKEILKYRPK